METNDVVEIADLCTAHDLGRVRQRAHRVRAQPPAVARKWSQQRFHVALVVRC